MEKYSACWLPLQDAGKSGHRRFLAAIELGIESVPVEVKEFDSEAAELRALLTENAYRTKTVEQKIREAQAWQELETDAAKVRQQEAAALTNAKKGRASNLTLPANLPQASKGKTRDKVAARVGLKPRTYSKGLKVVNAIEQLSASGDKDLANAWRQVLNHQSVDAAYQLTRIPSSERAQILEKIATGEARSTNYASKLIRHSPSTTVLPILTDEDALIAPVVLDYTSPFQAGDVVLINITWQEKAGIPERKWNGFWGIVQGTPVGIQVNMGEVVVNFKQGDLQALDLPAEQLTQFKEIAKLILQLRTVELDEIEVTMLNFFQRRFEFTPTQLLYLKTISQIHLNS